MDDLNQLLWRTKLAQKHAELSGFVDTAAALGDIAAILSGSLDLNLTLAQQFGGEAVPRHSLH